MQSVIDDLTKEKMAFQRGMERSHEMMQTLVDENEAMTTQFNAQARALIAAQEELERRDAEVAAQGMVVTALAQERDAARAAAIEAHERSQRLSMEAIQLEERCLRLRSEELRLKQQMESAQADKERQDRALKAAAADRNEMQTALSAMQEERRLLQSKLRQMAVSQDLGTGGRRESEDGGEWVRRGEMRQGDIAGSPGGPVNTPATSAAPTPASTPAKEALASAAAARSARLAADLGTGLEDGHARNRYGGAEEGGDTTASLPPGGLFHHMARSMNGVPLGGVPVDKVGEDQLRLVDSIHQLLTEVEGERARAAAALDSAKEKISGLAAAKTDLETQLAATTQRLELAVAQSTSAKAAATAAAAAAAVQAATGGQQAGAVEEEVDVDGLLTTLLSFINPFGRRRGSG